MTVYSLPITGSVPWEQHQSRCRGQYYYSKIIVICGIGKLCLLVLHWRRNLIQQYNTSSKDIFIQFQHCVILSGNRMAVRRLPAIPSCELYISQKIIMTSGACILNKSYIQQRELHQYNIYCPGMWILIYGKRNTNSQLI